MKSAAAAMFLAGIFSLFGQARKSAREGEKQFRSGHPETAVKSFADAAGREPADPLWKFDLGTARSAGKADGRAELEAAAQGRDAEVAAAASYQLGTLDLRSKNYAQAVRNLRRALELRPGKADAKRNFEIALSKASEPPPKEGKGAPRPSSGRPRPSPAPARPQDSAEKEFQKRAGMSRSQAEALLRSLDDEQKQREHLTERVSGKDW